jgi:hypothetical protein
MALRPDYSELRRCRISPAGSLRTVGFVRPIQLAPALNQRRTEHHGDNALEIELPAGVMAVTEQARAGLGAASLRGP